MDDLWGNAWGSPDDDAKATAWSTSEKPQNDDHQEDDLAMPSWSTGPGIQWDEPSDTQGPLWSNAHHTAQDWSLEHPYGDISLANSRPAEPPADDNSTVELPVEAESPPHSPYLPQGQCDDISAPSLSRELDEELSPSPISSPPPPEPSPPSSPDAFGTFTIGAEHSDTAPFSTIGGSLGGQVYDNEWGSPWGSVSKDVDGESAQFDSDEWESAKLRQLEMDSRVVCTCEATRVAITDPSSFGGSHEGRLARSQDVADEDWQKRWHSGMDVDGVDRLLLRYIPVLTLPQLLPSSRSFTAKAMADAVKLSRNTALARTSPMSTFLAAKGSTAWETSVKSRIEKTWMRSLWDGGFLKRIPRRMRKLRTR
ncbi:hypothetical protein BJV77DRAFT_229640 [Russula vinacea]|nr:hypothetical protein BJV77DRAFT_229640 [Russula vinacea]